MKPISIFCIFFFALTLVSTTTGCSKKPKNKKKNQQSETTHSHDDHGHEGHDHASHSHTSSSDGPDESLKNQLEETKPPKPEPPKEDFAWTGLIDFHDFLYGIEKKVHKGDQDIRSAMDEIKKKGLQLVKEDAPPGMVDAPWVAILQSELENLLQEIDTAETSESELKKTLKQTSHMIDRIMSVSGAPHHHPEDDDHGHSH